MSGLKGPAAISEGFQVRRRVSRVSVYGGVIRTNGVQGHQHQIGSWRDFDWCGRRTRSKERDET